MPALDMQILQLGAEAGAEITMPKPPPMPVIDWAEVAPPMPEVPTLKDVHSQDESEAA
jgi:hypothetical protein